MAKIEENRIIIAEHAMVDHGVAEVLSLFACRVSALLSTVGSPQKYQEIAEELCRISRGVIWSFVNSVFCNSDQVELAATKFEEVADRIDPSCALDPSVVTGFQSSIRARTVQLHVAVHDYQTSGSSVVFPI